MQVVGLLTWKTDFFSFKEGCIFPAFIHWHVIQILSVSLFWEILILDSC